MLMQCPVGLTGNILVSLWPNRTPGAYQVCDGVQLISTTNFNRACLLEFF